MYLQFVQIRNLIKLTGSPRRKAPRDDGKWGEISHREKNISKILKIVVDNGNGI